jgi:parallel beta-helix repeat protein
VYSGGGMENLDESNPTVTNCILWGNTPDEIYDDGTGSTTVNYSDVLWSGAGGNNIYVDPVFLDAANGDLRLCSCSPCVDAGDNDAVPSGVTTDLDGNPRFVDDANVPDTGIGTPPIVDMGAYERQISSFDEPICNVTKGVRYCRIQAAIDDPCTVNGDEIEVAPGTYTEAIDFKGKAVRLYSSDGADVTTIDGTGNYHVVQCVSGEDANTVLEGFTITGGNANGTAPDNCGAGIYCASSSPTVTGCTFSGNSANASGGGMYCDDSSPTVTGCTFSGNSADYGGGLSNGNYSIPTVTGCTFSSNSADAGGGGMLNSINCSPTIINCVYMGNSANYGGGIYNYNNCSPTVTGCTFSDNSATTVGGGMYNRDSSSPTVTNCTFTNNEADTGGGAMHNRGSSPTVTNCIFWGDTPNEIYDDGTSSSTVSYSDVQGGWGDPCDNNINADPNFVDANNPDPNLVDLRLKPDSPCIDAGDSTVVLAVPVYFDLDGKDRYIDIDTIDDTGSGPWEFLDMGAYEFYCSGIPGDINCDGVVNFKDFAIMAENWLVGAEP